MAGRSLDDLGTEELSWVDFRAFVRWSPPASAYSRSVFGERAPWNDLATQLLAEAVNALRGGNWQRGGGKGPRPKPIEPPPEKAGFGETVMSMDDLDKRMGWSPRR
ncbi:hypothetical protein [Microbacterium aurantiacum]|uniref:hypothetical protein n=1 Tax=Microbacterium aurantiacum TaxID=162393 RepID=UPI00344AFAFE